jgi:arylsulfatase A-like enzyme
MPSHAPRAVPCLLAARLACILLCGIACGERPARPHVILVSIDTLRADHLGCYGYARDTSPRLDELARDAVVFRQAIAQAPSTLPSHASMLTSLLPSHHGASVANGTALSADAVTLAEVLRAAGYRTASFNGGVQLDSLYGLDRGFETWRSARPGDAGAEVLTGDIDRFDHVVEQATDWIGAVRPDPFFLFLHTYETHHPYTPDAETLAPFDADYRGDLPDRVGLELLHAVNHGAMRLDEDDLRHVVAAYDAEIRSVDAALGRLLDFLRSEGLYDRTLLIVTSDHGEEFGEHGFVGWHSHSLHDELLRVPLVVKLPGSRLAGRAVADQVRGIDLAPTILDELGIAPPDAFEGASVGPLMESDAPLAPRASVGRQDVVATDEAWSLRTPEWKWIRGRLYQLSADPGETVDVASRHAGVEAAMRAQLDALLRARPRPEPRHVRPGAALEERLRALGYVR